MAMVPIDDPKPALEEVDDHGRGDHLAHLAQITLGVQRVNEAIQSLLPRVLAKVR